MSSSSDNPLIRFAAFWWALGVFSLFAVILIALKIFGGGAPENDPLEEAAATKRYETASKIHAAQEANFAFKEVEAGKVVQVPPHAAFDAVGKNLLGDKVAKVEADTQIHPDGDIAKAKAAEQGPDMGPIDALTPPADTPVDPALIEAGKAGFMVCMACHGANGEGGPVGPPLAGSEWVTGPVSNLIRIQLRGLNGPMHIKGQLYTPVAPMAPLSYQTDDQIAAVLTFVRNSFGNKAAPVLPKQVEMLRSEVGKPMLTEADLIKP
ncbi:cytochrome c [Luteolibacter sp. GHJ8]|uniref:Cytochrome c n=1 Tax=Luteolibacter rhizosphaerae TaxID=2989719 RepID=A0ABT3G554_9BACT|nr:cytochrome c [Luteolibacter rhizosphaerae]MCW1914624.1 cytochrome c [Luteolibacter rhizosphaerae]